MFRIFCFFLLFYLGIFFVEATTSANSTVTRFGNEKKGKRQVAHAHLRSTPGTAEASSDPSEFLQSQQIPIYGHQSADQYARRVIKQNIGDEQERQQQQPNEVNKTLDTRTEQQQQRRLIHFYFQFCLLLLKHELLTAIQTASRATDSNRMRKKIFFLLFFCFLNCEDD